METEKKGSDYKVKLTEKKAIELSIKLWTWLAETGQEKTEWSDWNKYGYMKSQCFLCEYADTCGHGCSDCPYYKKFRFCVNSNTNYERWARGTTKRTKKKKYAKLFLEQLNQLLPAKDKHLSETCSGKKIKETR